MKSSGTPIRQAIKSLQLCIPPAIKEATKILRDSLSDSSTNNNNNNKEDEPQRVTCSNSKPQRVEKETETEPQRVSVSEARGRYNVGTIISKYFDGIPYRGKIIKPYDGRYYRIEYDDGDEEDMTHTDVRKHLPKVPYTGGWGAAMQAILTKNAPMSAIARDSIHEAQNRAFAVTHPITGKQMEYKDLIKDPEFRDDWLRSKSNELGRLLQEIGRNADGTQRIKGYDCCNIIYKYEVKPS